MPLCFASEQHTNIRSAPMPKGSTRTSFRLIFGFRLEVVGRFPDPSQAVNYGISRDLPVFLSVMCGSDKETHPGYYKYLEETNNYFSNGYLE